MTRIAKGVSISIEGNRTHLMKLYLQVFLARTPLAKKQLTVATELALKYSEYIGGGVKEPFASQLLFSSETRKEIASKLGISVHHMNNTFKTLADKNVLALEDGKYLFNPHIVIREYLTFKFIENDQSGESSKGSGQEDGHTQEESKGSVTNADVHDTSGSEEQGASDVLSEESGILYEPGIDQLSEGTEAENEEPKDQEYDEETGLPIIDTLGGQF